MTRPNISPKFYAKLLNCHASSSSLEWSFSMLQKLLSNDRHFSPCNVWKYLAIRGGVLEDILGLKDVLEDTFWSPWLWPQSFRSSKIACPALRSRTALFFDPLKFCWKTPETSRKICKYLFCFAQLEHRLSQAGLPPIEISPMTKMWQKKLLFLQFQFLFSAFRLHQ